ncbi:DUF1016 N-terminal domain-containing protein [Myceligenerans indicum]|uniref:DUF1016 domain-containing protein n=1 Tax=Myceligenerans indicum TaxID=2593663 RepID=A0ABS1LM14_9MICO|nr:DUF1016 N-terminal domain-containing protein [Myceligenerans indicum]MBL0887320.1 DUF1016 domain-containing protein [Myceligenerans indicum]
MTMTTTLPAAAEPVGYTEFYDALCNRLREGRLRAAQAANIELLLVYWRTGKELVERDSVYGWGTKAVERISEDLHRDFMTKGWTVADIVHMRQFAEAWPDDDVIARGPVGLLPWEHVIVLLDRLDTRDGRDRYAAKAIKHGWSATTLAHAIEHEPRRRLTECLIDRRVLGGHGFDSSTA